MFAARTYRRNSTRSFSLVSGVTLALLAVAAAGANAQNNNNSYTLGANARAFAMGGAGVALVTDNGLRINPSSLAFARGAFALNLPAIGYRTENINGDLGGFLTGKMETAAANTVVQKFASNAVKQDANFGVNADLSLRIGKFEVSGFAVGKANLLPNEALKTWASGSTTNDLTTIPVNSKLDLIAAGYYALPAVAGAVTLPGRPDSSYRYGVGARVKQMRGVYTHYIADDTALGGTSDALLAPEMGTKDYLSKTSIGADLGFLAQPRKGGKISFGAVAANLVKPSLTFNGTDRDGNAFRYDLVKTTYTAGLGYQMKATSLALDVADITAATGKAQLRVGAEQRFLRFLALRAGYNTDGGVTYGAGLFGFDVAVGKKLPLEVIRTLNF